MKPILCCVQQAFRTLSYLFLCGDDGIRPACRCGDKQERHRVMVINYDSLMELRAAWESLERTHGSRRRTTVLVLDRNFAGHLPSLIRREHAESRLIIAAVDGPLPRL